MTANINLSLFAIFPSVLRCCVALEKCEYYVVSPLTPTAPSPIITVCRATTDTVGSVLFYIFNLQFFFSHCLNVDRGSQRRPLATMIAFQSVSQWSSLTFKLSPKNSSKFSS
jgi:hypothetical protein